MSKHTEMSKFSSNGKTFFFNRALAKNNSPYLAINSLYGRGNQERLVLFEPHWIQFKRHLDAAIASLTGMQLAEVSTGATAPTLPSRCPSCAAESGNFYLDSNEKQWSICCKNCLHVIHTTEIL